jgi:hypothetical protein
MPLQAQDGDEAVTFATLTLVGGSVVSTIKLPIYLQERFGTDCAGGWVSCWGWSVPLPGFNPWTVHPIASCYTD